MNAEGSIKKFHQPVLFSDRKAFALLLGLWFVLGTSHAFGVEMVILTKADNGREIKVAAGGRLRIELQQAGAAGYAWEVQDLDPELFEVQEAGTTERPGPQDIVGAPVTMRWILLAKKAGRAELRFFHYRPWEGRERALETFFLRVQIL